MKLLRISAVWCPACIIMRPRVDKLLEEFPSIESIEYDYDMDEDIIEKYQIKDILPVFILCDNDKELVRIIGEKSIEQMKEILKGCLK